MVVRFRRLRGNIGTNGNNKHNSISLIKPMIAKETNVATENEENDKKNGKVEDISNDTISETTSTDCINSNLLSTEILDWEKLPMFNIGPNTTNSSLTFTSLDNTCMGGDLDDLFNQLYSDVNSVFTDDSDFC